MLDREFFIHFFADDLLLYVEDVKTRPHQTEGNSSRASPSCAALLVLLGFTVRGTTGHRWFLHPGLDWFWMSLI